jgi:hypothetical protein
MEVVSLRIPAGMYVGNSTDHRRLDEDTITYVAADSLAAAQTVVAEFYGEMSSSSFTFSQPVVLSAALERSHQKAQEQKAQGYTTPEENHIRLLLRKAAWDLGSIVIDRAFFVMSNEGKRLMGARIEAHEGERRRVAYIEELGTPFESINPEHIIHALEEKF